VKLIKSLNSLYEKNKNKHATSILFIEQEESMFLQQGYKYKNIGTNKVEKSFYLVKKLHRHHTRLNIY